MAGLGLGLGLGLGRRCWDLGLAVFIWQFLLQTGAGSDFYRLAIPERTCTSAAHERETVDLVCQHYDLNEQGRSKYGACALQSMRWQRLWAGHAINVTASSKYGVWEAIPGWGMAADEHVGVLRVRDVRHDDIGTYRCEITCRDRRGKQRKLYHNVDLCLQQPNHYYAICGAVGGASSDDRFCASAFRNGVCDLTCDAEKHLYDGHDCVPQLQPCEAADDAAATAAETTTDDYCRSNYNNGVCDSRCETPQCAWDGGDCIATPVKFAEDSVVLFLNTWGALAEDSPEVKALGRAVSMLLRTVVRVTTKDAQSETPSRGSDTSFDKPIVVKSPIGLGEPPQKLYVQVDLTKCTNNCFRKAEKAAQFIALSLKSGWHPGVDVGLSSVGVLVRMERKCRLVNNSMLQIDLDSLDDGRSAWSSPDGAGSGGYFLGLETWVLVAVATGAVCLLVLVLAVAIAVCRVRSVQRYKHEEQTYLDSTRVRMGEKDCPMGTDV